MSLATKTFWALCLKWCHKLSCVYQKNFQSVNFVFFGLSQSSHKVLSFALRSQTNQTTHVVLFFFLLTPSRQIEPICNSIILYIDFLYIFNTTADCITHSNWFYQSYKNSHTYYDSEHRIKVIGATPKCLLSPLSLLSWISASSIFPYEEEWCKEIYERERSSSGGVYETKILFLSSNHQIVCSRFLFLIRNKCLKKIKGKENKEVCMHHVKEV